MTRALPPRITIITPSYNSGRFLEACILSVLQQDYGNLEYMIFDGGSTDNSVAIISRYATQLAKWVSAPDRGQAHAINLGLAAATGDIVAYLNADDTYAPGALSRVSAIFAADANVQVVFGDAQFIDAAGRPLRMYPGCDVPFSQKIRYWQGWPIPQPTVFLRRCVIERYGGPDERFRYALDYDWFLRISRHERFHHAGAVLAHYRLHSDSKTGDWSRTRHRFYAECRIAVRKCVSRTSPLYWSWLGSYAWHRASGRVDSRRLIRVLRAIAARSSAQ